MTESGERTATQTMLSDDEFAERVFKALAAKPRRDIIALLARGTSGGDCCSTEAICACDFSEQLGIGAPTVSHHMRILIDAGLVTSEKRGQWVHYQLRRDGVDRLMRVLGTLAGCDAG